MTYGQQLSPAQQWFDNNGKPLASGKIYTYAPGTTTPKATYSDAGLTTPNTNPIVLDSSGRAQVWGGGLYKIIIKTSSGTTVETRDDVNLSDGTFIEGITVTGDSTITGGLDIDHTDSLIQPYPIKLHHSNIFTNSDTYGSGSVLIEAKGLNNNQPLAILRYNVNDSSFGNVGPVLWNTGGGSANYTATNAFAVTIEFISNNSLARVAETYNGANGKWEIGSVCGRDAGTTIFKDGYFYFSPRRGPLNPLGANTGFDGAVFALTPATVTGGAQFITQGTGIVVAPKYDYTKNSVLSYTDDYNNSIWSNTATLTGKYARIENTGMADTYIRTRSQEGEGVMYVQSDADNARAEIRANWITAGTNSAYINLYTINDGTGWRVQANGVNGKLNIRNITAGTIKESVDISTTLDGLVSIYRHSDYTKGRLRLSNGTGAVGGGIFEYDSNTGVLDFTGTNNYITTGSSGHIMPTRLQYVTATNGATTTVTLYNTKVILDNAGIATHTVQLPTTPPDGWGCKVAAATGTITTLTISSADGAATFTGMPTTLTVNTGFEVVYRASNNKWYRMA